LPRNGHIRASNMGRKLTTIFGSAGLAALALSAVLFAQSWHLVGSGRQAEGTVNRVQLDSIYGGGGRGSGIMYYAFVRFRTESGEAIEFRSHQSNKPLYRKGQRVPVAYDPAFPEKARIASFGVLWAAPLFAAAAGIVLIVFAIGYAARPRGITGQCTNS